MSDETKKSHEEEMEAGFNDAELQDIMSEIESLEQEFSDSQSEEAEEACEEIFDEADFEEEAEAEVHSLPERSAPAMGHAHFEASGQMDMKLTIPMGDHSAHLCWGEKGLSVCVGGVEIFLSPDSCDVEMPGGARFSVPVQKSSKKAA
jgi:archaellum component FlaD/FlaE